MCTLSSIEETVFPNLSIDICSLRVCKERMDSYCIYLIEISPFIEAPKSNAIYVVYLCSSNMWAHSFIYGWFVYLIIPTHIFVDGRSKLKMSNIFHTDGLKLKQLVKRCKKYTWKNIKDISHGKKRFWIRINITVIRVNWESCVIFVTVLKKKYLVVVYILFSAIVSEKICRNVMIVSWQ